MVLKCNNKFWLNNPEELFCDYRVIPTPQMTLEKQMNSITRLIFFLFLVLYFLNYKGSFLFLLLSNIVLIILYYLQKNKMSKITENYNGAGPRTFVTDIGVKTSVNSQKTNLMAQQTRLDRYCDTDKTLLVPRQNDFPEIPLVGPANPQVKLNTPLWMVPPIYDYQSWRDNESEGISKINTKKTIDLVNSGYLPKTNCNRDDNVSVKEYYTPSKSTMTISGMSSQKQQRMADYNNKAGPVSPFPVKENFVQDLMKEPAKYMVQGGKTLPNIDTACGYNPENLKYNLPINYNASKCEQTDNVKNLNANTFTMQLTPSMANAYEVIEPVNANIGVSMALPRRSVKREMLGDREIFISREPDDEVEVFMKDVYADEPTPASTYDPRVTGYGPSYRGYYEKESGSQKYYYQDIDAVYRNNILAKSTVDIFDGSFRTGLHAQPVYDLDQLKQIENNRYIDNTNFLRSSIQQSQMEHLGDREWQLKKYPTTRMMR